MTIYVSEYEMVQRFEGGLKQSASAVTELQKSTLQERPEIVVKFIDGIKVAAGSAHQLCHAQENPHFLDIRDKLEAIISQTEVLVTSASPDNPLWTKIREHLLGIADKGKRMATSKGMTRAEVLTNLDVRSKILNETLNTSG